MTVFALISETKLVGQKELYLLSRAMQRNAADCAKAWSLATPAVVAVDKWLDLEPLPNVFPVVFTEDEDVPDALAVHYWDVFRGGPAARVFVEYASGLATGRYSLAEACGNEITEAMCDPQVNRWVDITSQPGMQMALEVADPVQDAYHVMIDEEDWPLANFVFPQYFEGRYEGEALDRYWRGGGRFDMLGTIHAPFKIGPEGYAVLRRQRADGSYVTYPVYGGLRGVAERQKAKRHPWARTRVRGVAS